MKRSFSIVFICIVILASVAAFTGKQDAYKGFSIKNFENTLALIPEGSFIIGQCDQDVPYVHAEKCRTVSTDTFYISKFEVSNGQYLEFLSEIKKRDTSFYKIMLPDTLVWRKKYAECEPFIDYYLRHPAYSNYPVAGVSYEQADAFCKWLTQKYMSEPKRKFKSVCFKLPTREQWIYAAKGKSALSPFPWNGLDMQNKKGEWLANFRAIPQFSIGRDSLYVKNYYGQYEKKQFNISDIGYVTGATLNPENDADITVPVNSFYPNGYGLFNMAGNVEEFVREKGKTHGGSWHDTGYYLQNHIFESYDTLHSASAERGFRFIMEIEK
ncbi:MAG: SUMF1/EgtB/PvdO family nonheme iron enzyme [Bacteroidota bacterium]|nr:SUMF1/EgtB/PvdO family nonheme iron enzyme [Bacteroidota bacterium]